MIINYNKYLLLEKTDLIKTGIDNEFIKYIYKHNRKDWFITNKVHPELISLIEFKEKIGYFSCYLFLIDCNEGSILVYKGESIEICDILVYYKKNKIIKRADNVSLKNDVLNRLTSDDKIYELFYDENINSYTCKDLINDYRLKYDNLFLFINKIYYDIIHNEFMNISDYQYSKKLSEDLIFLNTNYDEFITTKLNKIFHKNYSFLRYKSDLDENMKNDIFKKVTIKMFKLINNEINYFFYKYSETKIDRNIDLFNKLKNRIKDNPNLKDKYKHLFNANNFDLI